jgi:hypothetical protein
MSHNFADDRSSKQVPNPILQQEERSLQGNWPLRVERAKELLSSQSAVQPSDSAASGTQFLAIDEEKEMVSYWIGCEGELGGPDTRYWISINLAPIDTPTIFFNGEGPIQLDSQSKSDFDDHLYFFFSSNENFSVVDEALSEGFKTLERNSRTS